MEEIIELFMQYYKNDEQNGLKTLEWQAKEIIEKGKEYGEQFLFDIKKYAEDMEYCPNCFTKLLEKISKEYHTHLYAESIRILYCDSCGWRQD